MYLFHSEGRHFGSRKGNLVMLVLSRKVGEAIRIGNDIEVVVLAAHNGRVKIGISAPRHVGVFRGELAEAAKQEMTYTETWLPSADWANEPVGAAS
jgi:carbon storage regulator CsrA